MKMYFNFDTNIPDSINDLSTVQVEAITFRHTNGQLIEVQLNGEASYGVENGVYDAQWKGLEFHIDDGRYKDDYCLTDASISEEDCQKLCDLLKESSPHSIDYYWDDSSPEDLQYWNVPCGDFEPTCENINISIEIGEFQHTWSYGKL